MHDRDLSRLTRSCRTSRIRVLVERTLCYTKPMDESEPNPGQQLTVVPAAKAARLVAALATTTVVPAIVADAGDAAAKRFLEFFAVTDVGGDMQRLDFVQGAKLVMLAPVEELAGRMQIAVRVFLLRMVAGSDL